MRNNASEIASSVCAKPILALEQGAKRQGNLPTLEPGGNERAYRKVLRLCSMSSALL